jgi:hypothetical protein
MRKKLFAWVGAVVTVFALGISGTPAQAVSLLTPPPLPNPLTASKGKPSVPVASKPMVHLPPDPFAPAVHTDSVTPCASVPCYAYSEQKQTFTAGNHSTGASETVSVSNPYLAISGTNNNMGQTDGHTLYEQATSLTAPCTGCTGRNILEVGWNVDPSVNGDTNTHTFIYSWINDVGQGYNGSNAGWIDNGANPVNAGSDITSAVGTNKSFGIAHDAVNSRWEVSYNGTALGWINDSTWASGTNSFTDADAHQLFGEMASGTTQDMCSDMASGAVAGTAPSGIVSGYSQTGPATSALTAGKVTNATFWSQTTVSTTSFRFGGPGSIAAPNTGVDIAGTRDHCSPNAEGVPAASSFQFWQESCPDNAASTGCNNAINFPWSSLTVGTCVTTWATKGTRQINAVWNNAGSSGKTVAVYDGGGDQSGCDGNTQSFGNAVKAKLTLGGTLDGFKIVAIKRTA